MAPKTQLNLRISEQEMDILKQYCQQEDREQSEVIREFIRSLKKKIRANTQG
jgi:protein-arginine kinase activator protein McsA